MSLINFYQYTVINPHLLKDLTAEGENKNIRVQRTREKIMTSQK